MATHFEQAREDYEIFEYCWSNGHQQWLETAIRCRAFLNNDQWNAAIKAALEAKGRPALTINKFAAIWRAICGAQLTMRSDIRFTALKDATRDEARVMDKVYLHIAQQNSLDWVEQQVFGSGLLTGRGYYQTRVEYDDQWMGNIVITEIPSDQVVLDPDFCTYNPAGWPQWFRSNWMNITDIEATYGKDFADELRHSPTTDVLSFEESLRVRAVRDLDGVNNKAHARMYRMVERQWRENKVKEVFVDTQTGDITEIPETWDGGRIKAALDAQPSLTTTKRKVKTIKWRITSNGLVAHNDDSPYNNFNINAFFPYFVCGQPIGHMESLLDMQELYNKVVSQNLHILNTTANSGYKVKVGSLQNMTPEDLEERGAETGLVIELSDINDLEKIQPNQIPTGHDRFSATIDNMMDTVSGSSDSSRGFAREDVAGKAIQENTAQNYINYALMFSNLYMSKTLLGENIRDCVQSTYTETRTLVVTGGIAQERQDEVTINQPTPEGQLLNDVTRGKYSVTAIPSKARTTLEEGEFQDLLSLRDMGIMIPDAVLIEASPLSRKQEVLEAMQGDSVAEQQRQAEAEAAIRRMEEEVAMASVRKSDADAALSQARANKANVEAERGVDEQNAIERERVDAERARDAANQDLAQKKLDLEREKSRRDAAIKLTDIKVKAKTAKETKKASAKPSTEKRK